MTKPMGRASSSGGMSQAHDICTANRTSNQTDIQDTNCITELNHECPKITHSCCHQATLYRVSQKNCLYITQKSIINWLVFATRCYVSTAYVVMRCRSVCLCVSVTSANSVKINKCIFKNFSPSGSQASLGLPYQMAWQYSDRNPLNGGIECRWGRQKSWLQAYIWLHCMLSMLRPARCYQHGAARLRSHKMWHLSL